MNLEFLPEADEEFREASRYYENEAPGDGAPPIEFVDGDDLATLFENLEFGLRPRKTFDIDDKFFDEFR